MTDPVEEAAKLPLNQRIEHTHWKVRSNAYEELAKKFNEAIESTSSIFSEYAGYFKKMLNDKNVAAMEKALEPIYSFYDRYDHAAKITPNLAPLVIEKCLGARQGTKQRATELLILMVEVDTSAEAVVVGLVEGANNKVPKVAVASIHTIELILKTFGVKVVPLKPILAAFLPWFDHTNAEARTAAQTFTIELYRWVGGTILDKPIANLRQAQVTELQKAFADIQKGTAVPEKYLRCQVDQMQAAAAAASSGAKAPAEEVDPFNIVEAVNLVSKITPELYEALQSKKWKDKKEALEAINKIADTPRLASGDYGELVKNCKRLLGDANVFVVEESVRCLGFLARGLRGEFSAFAKNTMATLLDKLKEKKDKVINALHATFDSYHPHCFALADIAEDLTVASKHKVPQVKKEILVWFKRALPKEKRALLSKSLKYWCTMFMELIEDPDSPVRENAFECFGLLIGIVGEKSVTGFLNQIDKVKEKRIREFIPTTPIPPPASDSSGSSSSNAKASAAATPMIDVNANVNLSNVPTQKKSSAKASSSSIPSKAPAAASAKPITSAVAKEKPSTPAPSSSSPVPVQQKTTVIETFSAEPRISSSELESSLTDLIPETALAQLSEKEWKARVDAMTIISNVVEKLDSTACNQYGDALLLFLSSAKPSMKDSNIQVLIKLIEVLKRLLKFEKTWNKNDVYIALVGIVDHIAEAKLTAPSIDLLNTIGENNSLGIQYVFNALYTLAKAQTNPKAIIESIAYMTTALSEFGGDLIELKNLTNFTRTCALEHTNATVKATGIRLLCEVYKHMGPSALMPLLAEVKPQILTAIKKEFDKISSDKPMSPVRGPNGPAPVPSSSASPSSITSNNDALSADIPRIDISATINALLPGLSHTDWQKRQETMAQLESALIEARRIQPKGVTALMTPLKSRLSDSNINLIPAALSILGELAKASGPSIESHMKTVMPSILGCYASGKPTVKTACSACLDLWVNETGMDPILAFLPTALGTPSGRADLLGWISTKLGYVKKGDVKVLLKPAFHCYSDKTKEVRAVAETTIVELAKRLTAKVVEGECGKLAPAILTNIRALMKAEEAEINKKPTPPAMSASVPQSKTIIASKIPAGPVPVKRSSSPPPSPAPIGKMPQEEPTHPSSSANLASSSQDEPSQQTTKSSTGLVLRNNRRMDRELETLIWLFDSPVPHKFIDALKEQASNCVAPELYDRFFSTDPKNISTAISDLESSVDKSKEAVQDSLDVILKWCSLVLFNSNAAILKKVVALLEHLIGTLEIWDHKMSELEAASIVMILVVRLPHLNESNQSAIRTILQEVEQKFYPPSKLFQLWLNTPEVWTGSHALSVSSRVECIRFLSSLIRKQSLSVTNPSEALRIFSGLISESCDAVVIATLDLFVECSRSLSTDESLWQYIAQEHHELIRAYIANPVQKTYEKFKDPTSATQDHTAPNDQQAEMSPSNAKKEENPAPASAVKEVESAIPVKPQPVLEKVTISKATTFKLDLDNMHVEPLPANLDIPLPPGIGATLLPSHISSDPTPFLTSKQQSRIIDPQAKDKKSPILTCVQAWDAALASNDIMRVCETLKDVFDSFNQNIQTFAFHIPTLLISVLSLLKASFGDLSPIGSSSASQLTAMRNLVISILTQVFSDETQARFVPPNLVASCLPQILEPLVGNMPVAPEEKDALVGNLNAVAVKILNNADLTAVFKSMLQELRTKIPKPSETSKTNGPYLEVVRKCLSRAVKAMPSSMSKISVSSLLYDFHLFFVAHPPHTIKSPVNGNTNNDLLATLDIIKIAIDTLIQYTGTGVLQHINTIPHTIPLPAIRWYIRMSLLKHSPGIESNESVMKAIQAPTVDPEVGEIHLTELSENPSSLLPFLDSKPSVPQPEFRLPVHSDDQAKRQGLKHVLQKIAKKETTQQGLVDLWWLQKDHSDIQLESLLRNTSVQFRTYISDSLRKFSALAELEATAAVASIPTSKSPSVSIPDDTIQSALTISQDVSAQLSRLRSLQSKLQLGKPSESIVLTELDPASLNSIVRHSTSTSSTTSSSINSATTSGKANINGLRERLRNASANVATANDSAATKYDLPALQVVPTSISKPLPTSYDLPDLGIPSPGGNTEETTSTSRGPSSTVESVQAQQVPTSIPANPPKQSVEGLRERLAKIKMSNAAK